MTAVYRIRQGLRALFAFARPVDDALVGDYLSAPLIALFRQMRPADQLHSLNVLNTVLAQGDTPSSLTTAALLHDVGKSRYPLAVSQKTLAVLVRALIPSLFDRWSAGDPDNFWQRPFVVYAQHPRWSADLIRLAGGSPDAIWLTEHHADDAEQWRDHPLYTVLKRLQAADDTN